jgi:hypothetical protein
MRLVVQCAGREIKRSCAYRLLQSTQQINIVYIMNAALLQW